MSVPGMGEQAGGGKGGPMGMAKQGATPPPMQLMQGKMPLPPGVNLIMGAKGKEQPDMPGLGGKGGGKGGGEKKESK